MKAFLLICMFLDRGNTSNRQVDDCQITSIYTIIFHKSVCLSVCRRSQTAGRNSCSIVSGDVYN